jgi:hypothetical protein
MDFEINLYKKLEGRKVLWKDPDEKKLNLDNFETNYNLMEFMKNGKLK